jgi:hypothetical protein
MVEKEIRARGNGNARERKGFVFAPRRAPGNMPRFHLLFQILSWQ